MSTVGLVTMGRALRTAMARAEPRCATVPAAIHLHKILTGGQDVAAVRTAIDALANAAHHGRGTGRLGGPTPACGGPPVVNHRRVPPTPVTTLDRTQPPSRPRGVFDSGASAVEQTGSWRRSGPAGQRLRPSPNV